MQANLHGIPVNGHTFKRNAHPCLHLCIFSGYGGGGLGGQVLKGGKLLFVGDRKRDLDYDWRRWGDELGFSLFLIISLFGESRPLHATMLACQIGRLVCLNRNRDCFGKACLALVIRIFQKQWKLRENKILRSSHVFAWVRTNA